MDAVQPPSVGPVIVWAARRPRSGICYVSGTFRNNRASRSLQSEFETKGETREFRGRSFCPKCGSRLFSADEQEAEIKLGICLRRRLR